MKDHAHLHTSHPDIVQRLKRAEGHLRKTIEMIETGRKCVEIAQQLHAVEKAIANAKTELIHDHIDGCLTQALANGQNSGPPDLEEFRSITKFL
jgi:DNA-binding FrmR family transcriptional regulator